MTKHNWLSWGFSIASGLVLAVAVISLPDRANAQINPDTSLGNENSTVEPDVSTRRGNERFRADRIRGGARRGANLFHSFERFNIREGRRVYFDNPAGVRNIFGRVTGGDRSTILGRLGVLGDANLFLINPNGILFGPRATLDIRGSFVATTAPAVQFGNQGFFNAVDPNVPPLLTVDPSALLFNQIGAAPITNSANARASMYPPGIFGLYVPNGQSLLLVGGDINMMNEGTLNALDGHVEVASLAGRGAVGLTMNDNLLRLTVPDGMARADVRLTGKSRIVVRNRGSGSIVITARNVDILESSILRAGINARLTSNSNQPGDITVNATGTITLAGVSSAGRSAMLNSAGTAATGNGGDINITTGSLILESGAQLNVSVAERVRGNPGSITIHARDLVEVKGEQAQINPDGTIDWRSSIISSEVEPRAVSERPGNIEISARTLRLTDGGHLSASTNGQGNAGSIIINVQNAEFSGIAVNERTPSGAFSQVLESAGPEGIRGGNVTVRADSLTVIDGAVLSTSTRGRGDAGNVVINAGAISFDGEQRSINFSSSGAYSRVQAGTGGAGGIGDAGRVEITADSLQLTNGAVIETSTDSQGNAGKIEIESDRILLSGRGRLFGQPSGIFSRVGADGEGQGGAIQIETGFLFMTAGGAVDTGTSGRGNGGGVTISAADQILIDGAGSSISSRAESTGSGDAGSIRLITGELYVQNGARIAVSSEGAANAGSLQVTANAVRLGDRGNLTADTESGTGGDIQLNIRDFLSLDASSRISAFTENSEGGRLTLNADRPPTHSVILSSGSTLSTEAQGEAGNAGRLSLNTRELRIRDRHSAILATSLSGIGGDIAIAADRMTVENGASVSASTLAGAGGSIRLAGLRQLTVDNASISAFAEQRSGRAGNLEIRNADSVELTNRGQLSVEARNGGTAGNLTINTGELRVEDGARVTVSSPTGAAGNLTIDANTVALDRGQLTAQTGVDRGRAGANLRLQNLEFLTLRHGSQVEANAGAAARGGNITIDAGLIVAVPQEDSNITANAVRGRGGDIRITTQSLLGIEQRPALTDLSDITASSEFGLSGTIDINQPDVQPEQTAAELPNTFAAPPLAQGCDAARSQTGSFVSTGRGGVPQNPTDPLMANTLWQDVGPLPFQSADRVPGRSVSVQAEPEQVVEAQGWVTGSDGAVILTAQAPTPPAAIGIVNGCRG